MNAFLYEFLYKRANWETLVSVRAYPHRELEGGEILFSNGITSKAKKIS